MEFRIIHSTQSQHIGETFTVDSDTQKSVVVPFLGSRALNIKSCKNGCIELHSAHVNIKAVKI